MTEPGEPIRIKICFDNPIPRIVNNTHKIRVKAIEV